jgi:hypothetical protein
MESLTEPCVAAAAAGAHGDRRGPEPGTEMRRHTDREEVAVDRRNRAASEAEGHDGRERLAGHGRSL